jgi:predicted DNA binding protein
MLKEVSLSVNDAGPFGELAQRHNSKIAVAECKVLDSRGMVLLLEIDSSIESELMMKDLKGTPGVRHVYWARNGGKDTLAMVTIDTPLFCEIAKSSGALCRSCPLNSSGGEVRDWSLLIKDASVLRRCTEMLEGYGFRTQIRDVSDAIRKDVLTSRQREIVLEAIRLGYFDLPRRIDLTQLAMRLSVKPPTLMEILRRAQGKMARYYLESSGAMPQSLAS